MNQRHVGLRRPMGSLEADVLATLWAADGPLTPSLELSPCDAKALRAFLGQGRKP